MSVPTALAPAVDALRAAIRGRVVTPDDVDYDRLRTIAMGGFDPRPAASHTSEPVS